mgnify:CR=1 FL=1
MGRYSHVKAGFLPTPPIRLNAFIPDFLDKRLLFVTGKGGVGKTTVAMALGIRAAMEGKRTIVCEVAATENASRLFAQSKVGFREVELANDLWAISIDPDESMREYVLLQLKVKAMRDLLFRSRMFTYLAAATPGLNEALSAYEGVNIGSGAIDFAARLITSDRPPQVVYIEDSASRNIDDLWSFIQAARARQVTVLIGLQGIGLNRMADFVDAGLPITDGRGAHEISAWIGGQLGVRKRAAVQQTVIAVAGAEREAHNQILRFARRESNLQALAKG